MDCSQGFRCAAVDFSCSTLSLFKRGDPLLQFDQLQRPPLHVEHAKEKVLHNDMHHRSAIPLAAGALIVAALAIIWRWIS